MRNNFGLASGNRNSTQLRIDAVRCFAEGEIRAKNRFKDHVSAVNTINDALARRLKPDVASIGAFDELVGQRLRKDSMALRDILSKHSKDISQRVEVSKFFAPPVMDPRRCPIEVQIVQGISSKTGGIGTGKGPERPEKSRQEGVERPWPQVASRKANAQEERASRGGGGPETKQASSRKESFLRTGGGPEPHEKRPLIFVRGLS